MVLITATGFCVLLTSVIVLVVYDRYKFRQSLASELSILSRTINSDLVTALAFDYENEARETLQNLRAKRSIITGCVYDNERTLFADYSTDHTQCPDTPNTIGSHYAARYMDHVSTLGTESEEPEGILLLRSSYIDLNARLVADVYLFLGILVVSSLLAFFLATRLHPLISGPIQNLAGTARRVTKEADYSVRAARHSDDEVGELVTSFNEMLSRMEERDKQLTAKSEELQQSHKQLEEYNRTLEDEVKRRTRELAAAKLEAERARDEAEKADRAKSVFLANMSHELRTPMNAIIGFNRIVMRRCKDTLPPKQYENLSKIAISADHLLTLINNILDLSKIEAGRMEVKPSPFNLDPLVEMCLRTVEPLVANKPITLEKEIPAESPTMETDQDKMKQILINLLSNAVKFTESGSVTVRAEHRDGQISVAVQDTGNGIPPEQLESIFEEFTQLDGSSTRRHGGTGLGLSITRHLTRLIGGHIAVQSEVGVGSTFTVTVPIRYIPSEAGIGGASKHPH